MKNKYIPLSLAAIILTSQLTGCASVPSNEMLEMLNNGQDIEITMAIPEYEIANIGTPKALADTQLDQLQTYIDGGFREEFDILFGITPLALPDSNTKVGCIFINKSNTHEGNTSFMDSLRNKVFMETYLGKPEILASLSTLAEKAYTDITAESPEAYLASLNAYYNLISDSSKEANTTADAEYYNSTQSISRGNFYSFVYRATTPVNPLLKVEGDFQTKVNTQDPNSLYASQVDQYAWLNSDNDGLRSGNYGSSISRAEAIYMLINMYFADELKAMDIASIQLDDAKDGGDYLEDKIPDKKESDQLYSVDKKTQDQTMAKGYQLGVISKMLKASDDSVQSDLYRALGVAESLGIIETETRFNEPLSKSEAIELLINTAKALNTRDGYQSDASQSPADDTHFVANGGQGVATVPDPDHPFLPSADPLDQPIPFDKETKPEATKPTPPPTSSKPESKPTTPESKPTPPASKPNTPSSGWIPPIASSGGGAGGAGGNGSEYNENGVWIGDSTSGDSGFTGESGGDGTINPDAPGGWH